MTDARDQHDDEAHDRLVDLLLEQRLAGNGPPDLAARIVAANAEQLRRAADHVDAAERIEQTAARTDSASETDTGTRPRRRPAPLPLVAAALVAAGLVLAAAAALWPGNGAQPPAIDVDARTQQLLDEFHAVMPHYPAMLRDERRRRAVAPRALPVIRSLLTHCAQHPDEHRIGERVHEFAAYATMLGDDRLRAELVRRSGHDATARAVLLVADFALADTDERSANLAALCELFEQEPAVAPRVARGFEVAELREAEALRLADSLADESTRAFVLRSAERAEASPRRWIGRTLPLAGATLDGGTFDVSDLRGDVAVVTFWATWCRPSLDELERVRDVQRQVPELAVVTVSCDHERSALRNCIADRRLDWPCLFDAARPGWHELAFACQVHAVPLTMLLDRSGVVRDVAVGSDADDLLDAVRAQVDR